MLQEHEYFQALHAPYNSKASSRFTPHDGQGVTFPVGTWRAASFTGIYGQEVAELCSIPLRCLMTPEGDYSQPPTSYQERTRFEDSARYAEWLQAGRTPPPIEVLQNAAGLLVVKNGHRRVAAAKLAGQTHITAWVSWLMTVERGDITIDTGLTRECVKQYGEFF